MMTVITEVVLKLPPNGLGFVRVRGQGKSDRGWLQRLNSE